MNEQSASTQSKLFSYLSMAEKIFFAGLLVGLMLMYFNPDNRTLIQASLIMLAASFFISAYKVIEIPRKEEDSFEFKEMLSWLIVPKVLWISCAISLVGLSIFLSQPDHEGYKRMFMIAGLSITIALAIIAYAFATGTKYLQYILPPVLRAVPLLIIDAYFLFS